MFIGFRPLEPTDAVDVLRIFAAREDYFLAANGVLPVAGDLQSMFSVLPDGATEGQKRLLAVVSDGALVGVIDAVVDYPELGAVSVGLFVLDPESPLHGFGMPIGSLAGERALAEGMTTVHIGCPAGWPPGESLLHSLGFHPVAGDAAPPNAVIRSNQGGAEIRRWVGQLSLPPQLPG